MDATRLVDLLDDLLDGPLPELLHLLGLAVVEVQDVDLAEVGALETCLLHNVPEEVVTVGLKSAVSWKNFAILSVIPPYKSENSFSLWPIRKWVCSFRISWLTSVGPGIKSFLCIVKPSAKEVGL